MRSKSPQLHQIMVIRIVNIIWYNSNCIFLFTTCNQPQETTIYYRKVCNFIIYTTYTKAHTNLIYISPSRFSWGYSPTVEGILYCIIEENFGGADHLLQWYPKLYKQNPIYRPFLGIYTAVGFQSKWNIMCFGDIAKRTAIRFPFCLLYSPEIGQLWHPSSCNRALR